MGHTKAARPVLGSARVGPHQDGAARAQVGPRRRSGAFRPRGTPRGRNG